MLCVYIYIYILCKYFLCRWCVCARKPSCDNSLDEGLISKQEANFRLVITLHWINYYAQDATKLSDPSVL